MLRRVFCKLLLVAIVIFSLLALSSAVMAQGRSADAFERVKEAQEKHTDVLMAMDGIEGTAIGYNQNDQLAVKVFTAGPGVRGIPQTLDGVPVQVVVTGKIYALTTGKYERPVPIGVSTGHPDITAGTIGCRVYEDINENGIRDVGEAVFALSNNHVYANSNEATIGDNVLQPGAYDGGTEGPDPDTIDGDEIGTLAAFEPIVFGPRGINTIDAAIASSTTSLLGNATPSDVYGTPNSTIVGAVLGQQVQKFGRTTQLTTGGVTGVNATVRVRYSSGFAYFVDQIIIEPGGFSEGGDSGSLIVTNDESCNPVGLLFAGSSTMTVANRIDLVLARFDVTVDDGSVGSTNYPPTADFSYTTTDLTADFTDLSTDSDGSVVGWDWDFGDGSTSTAQNPSHTYAADGTYSVSLTVTDDDGATGSTSQDVTVSDGTINDPPTADFSFTTTDLTADFTDLSTDSDGSVISWYWDFGDSITSTTQNPNHTYASSGTYTVTLTVADNEGATDSVSKDVTVTEAGEMAMHVDDIAMSIKIAGRNVNAKATVTILAADGVTPVAGATVYGYWDGATFDSDVGTTDTLGKVTLQSDKIKDAASGTIFIFIVDYVEKSGWTYDFEANVETWDSITVP